MRRMVGGGLRVLYRTLGYGGVGALAVAITVFVLYLESRPDLQPWHSVELYEEFTADAGVVDFAGYLEAEERVFDELQRRIVDEQPPGSERSLSRFSRGSFSDPERFSRNWNRTFVLERSAPERAVLLLHGMSDSPYSLRNIGLALHARDAYVIGLRIPGHGTAPVGLTMAKWTDMAAAVRLAMQELHERAKGAPLFVVGYSNGGALALHYALAGLDDTELPRLSGIALISPAIGVTPAAALAVWQERLGWLLGLDKLKWNSVLPEYDPYKYQSFAVNAGDQTYRLTVEVAALLSRAEEQDRIGELPPILAFQSAVDATVSTPAVITGLMDHLSPGGHELVLFDINRRAAIDQIVADDPALLIDGLFGGPPRRYAVTVLTNAAEVDDPEAMTLRRRHAGTDEVESLPVPWRWPEDVYSVSHVALPFPVSDPLYGSGDVPDPWHEQSPIALGHVVLRGERGVLAIAPGDLLRQRWNPFYALIERGIVELTSSR